ncbi:MAG: DUF2840 domain-containing protein [Casimicrobiaceae bacterium]
MTMSLTRVALVFVPEKRNVWLRFGRPAQETIIDRQRRSAVFNPGAVFCRIRWEANAYGTELWQLGVLQAAAPGETLQRIAGIVPGATLLLHVGTAGKVQAALRLIDAIEATRIDPTAVAPTYWRMVHNRLAARVEASQYTPNRHAAYLLRRPLA